MDTKDMHTWPKDTFAAYTSEDIQSLRFESIDCYRLLSYWGNDNITSRPARKTSSRKTKGGTFWNWKLEKYNVLSDMDDMNNSYHNAHYVHKLSDNGYSVDCEIQTANERITAIGDVSHAASLWGHIHDHEKHGKIFSSQNEQKEASVRDMANWIKADRSVVSRALKILDKAGLVRGYHPRNEKTGKVNNKGYVYRVNPIYWNIPPVRYYKYDPKKQSCKYRAITPEFWILFREELIFVMTQNGENKENEAVMDLDSAAFYWLYRDELAALPTEEQLAAANEIVENEAVAEDITVSTTAEEAEEAPAALDTEDAPAVSESALVKAAVTAATAAAVLETMAPETEESPVDPFLDSIPEIDQAIVDDILAKQAKKLDMSLTAAKKEIENVPAPNAVVVKEMPKYELKTLPDDGLDQEARFDIFNRYIYKHVEGRPWRYVWFKPYVDKNGKPGKYADRITDKDLTKDLYFTVNKCSKYFDPLTGLEYQDAPARYSDREIDHVNAVFLDIDAGRDPVTGKYYTPAEVAKRKPQMLDVLAALPKPTSLTETRNGYQPYWAIEDEKLNSLEPKELQKAWKHIEQTLFAVAGIADPAATDISRVLRMPGSRWNKDPEHPYNVTLKYASETTYTAESLLKALKDCKEAATKAVEEYNRLYPKQEKSSTARKAPSQYKHGDDENRVEIDFGYSPITDANLELLEKIKNGELVSVPGYNKVKFVDSYIDEIKKVDIAAFFGIDRPHHFRDILHYDNNPSGYIDEDRDEPGHFLYFCNGAEQNRAGCGWDLINVVAFIQGSDNDKAREYLKDCMHLKMTPAARRKYWRKKTA